MPEIKFKLLRDGAKLPAYKSKDAAAMDCYASLMIPSVRVYPGQTVAIPLGFAVEIPQGWEGHLLMRSGFALDNSAILANAPGLIDSDYRGEVKALIHNSGVESFFINDGDRIAQFKVTPSYIINPVIVDELSETERGDGGLGSTGKV